MVMHTFHMKLTTCLYRLNCNVYYSAVCIFWSIVRIFMELGQDSDIATFYTAVHILSSVARIYMELGEYIYG
jgi:hypothetical protein